MNHRVQIFISHISEEQGEALKAKEYLEQAFKDKVEIFISSSWTSIAPGQDWFQSISAAIDQAEIMLVFCSGDSVNRPWIQFEIGAGWFAKKMKVIPVCHKGMTPTALPEPIRRLQAVDINAPNEAEQLRTLAHAVKQVGNLPEPLPISAETLSVGIKTSAKVSLRSWFIRPAAHIGEELTETFKIGTVAGADPDRATKAGLDPDDAIYVRLFQDPPTGQYLNTMAIGDVATLLERSDMEETVIIATLKLASTHQTGPPDQKTVPVIVILKADKRPE